MSHRSRIVSRLYELRWHLCLFLAALVVRLHWNLAVHPPEDYVYSDMHGYVSRGLAALDKPFARREYAAFFPYGNHFLVAAVKWVFGRDNPHALGVVYALLGALVPPLAYGFARRSTRFSWTAPLTGALLVFHYPLIALGGYVLSEIPFCAALLAAHLFLVRTAESRRVLDAVAAGVFAALATAVRPQILMSMAVIGLLWLLARRAFPGLRLRQIAAAGIPVVCVLGLSAARLYHHTGRLGLVSENGSLNLAFGRCHAAKIESLPDGKGHGHVHFQPPSFLQMRAQERRGSRKWLDLDPALGYDISYRGYIGDARQHRRFIRKCIEKTGITGQLAYSFTNAVLLWKYNVPWPDSGRTQWRRIAAWWQRTSRDLYAVPSLLGLLFLFRPHRNPMAALAAAHLAALLLTSAIFFGSGRIRAPYDPFILFLALQVYATVAAGLWRHGRAWVQRRRSAASPSHTKDSG